MVEVGFGIVNRYLLQIVIPSKARDLHFAANYRSLPLGYARGRDDKI